MTPEQKALVRDSFARILPNSERMTARFYARLFEIDPTARPLFQSSTKSVGRKLIDTMLAVLDSLDRLEHVVPLVWQLGKRHAAYGVRTSHFDSARVALLWALEQEMGDAYTPETGAAWAEVYDLLAAAMKQAAAEREDSVS